MRVLMLLTLSAIACARPAEFPPSAPSTLLSKQLPAFQRAALDGQTIDTKALSSRPLVIKFFAEYCEPCKRTLPALEALHREYERVAFVGVSLDDSVAAATRIRERYGLSFPIVYDAGRVLAGRYRIVELPLTVVADETGVVRWVGGPAQTEEQLAQALAAVNE